MQLAVQGVVTIVVLMSLGQCTANTPTGEELLDQTVLALPEVASPAAGSQAGPSGPSAYPDQPVMAGRRSLGDGGFDAMVLEADSCSRIGIVT